MSDLLILAIVVSGALAALRWPWVGVMFWTWVSLMSPHQEFGYSAAGWPVATIVAATTLIGLLATKERHTPMLGAGSWLMLAFIVWMTITLPFSLYLDPSLPLWERTVKTFLMLFVSIALISSRKQLDYFVWVMVLSLGFYGVKGGIFTISTGGNFRVWGPGGFVQGNNEIALALIMTIPLMRYLQLQLTRPWARHAMTAAILLTAVTVLGTYSRGALLALLSMAFFLWLKGTNKLVYGVAMLAVGSMALPFMPEQWWDRMDTIKSYEQDDSALGRINAWWNAFNLAKDRLFGGGFMIYTPEVFARYSPDPERVHAAHSIYFQVLGEHGFVGLALFLAIGVCTWFTCQGLIRRARHDPQALWAGQLGAMIQVSMIGYATAGAFLSLTYFDLPYNLAAAAMLARYLLDRQAQAAPATVAGRPSVAAA